MYWVCFEKKMYCISIILFKLKTIEAGASSGSDNSYEVRNFL